MKQLIMILSCFFLVLMVTSSIHSLEQEETTLGITNLSVLTSPAKELNSEPNIDVLEDDASNKTFSNSEKNVTNSDVLIQNDKNNTENKSLGKINNSMVTVIVVNETTTKISDDEAFDFNDKNDLINDSRIDATDVSVDLLISSVRELIRNINESEINEPNKDSINIMVSSSPSTTLQTNASEEIENITVHLTEDNIENTTESNVEPKILVKDVNKGNITNNINENETDLISKIANNTMKSIIEQNTVTPSNNANKKVINLEISNIPLKTNTPFQDVEAKISTTNIPTTETLTEKISTTKIPKVLTKTTRILTTEIPKIQTTEEILTTKFPMIQTTTEKELNSEISKIQTTLTDEILTTKVPKIQTTEKKPTTEIPKIQITTEEILTTNIPKVQTTTKNNLTTEILEIQTKTTEEILANKFSKIQTTKERNLTTKIPEIQTATIEEILTTEIPKIQTSTKKILTTIISKIQTKTMIDKLKSVVNKVCSSTNCSTTTSNINESLITIQPTTIHSTALNTEMDYKQNMSLIKVSTEKAPIEISTSNITYTNITTTVPFNDTLENITVKFEEKNPSNQTIPHFTNKINTSSMIFDAVNASIKPRILIEHQETSLPKSDIEFNSSLESNTFANNHTLLMDHQNKNTTKLGSIVLTNNVNKTLKVDLEEKASIYKIDPFNNKQEHNSKISATEAFVLNSSSEINHYINAETERTTESISMTQSLFLYNNTLNITENKNDESNNDANVVSISSLITNTSYLSTNPSDMLENTLNSSTQNNLFLPEDFETTTIATLENNSTLLILPSISTADTTLNINFENNLNTLSSSTTERIITTTLDLSPVMIRQPNTIHFFSPEEPFVLVCEATSLSPVKYTWLKNGHFLSLEPGSGIFRESSENGNILFVKPKENDGGTYQCVAENKYGKNYSRSALVLLKKVTKLFDESEIDDHKNIKYDQNAAASRIRESRQSNSGRIFIVFPQVESKENYEIINMDLQPNSS